MSHLRSHTWSSLTCTDGQFPLKRKEFCRRGVCYVAYIDFGDFFVKLCFIKPHPHCLKIIFSIFRQSLMLVVWVAVVSIQKQVLRTFYLLCGAIGLLFPNKSSFKTIIGISCLQFTLFSSYRMLAFFLRQVWICIKRQGQSQLHGKCSVE